MVKVVYFASLRERLGLAEESVALTTDRATVATLLQQLVELHGEPWRQVLLQGPILTAVNQEMCDPEQPVKAGDEVAFFTPVTGG